MASVSNLAWQESRALRPNYKSLLDQRKRQGATIVWSGEVSYFDAASRAGPSFAPGLFFPTMYSKTHSIFTQSPLFSREPWTQGGN
jgi:hypothetical protein